MERSRLSVAPGRARGQTPAETTVPAIARSVLEREASLRRNLRCRRRVHSTRGRHTGPVSRCLIRRCQSRFDRLYKYDIAR
jgi:hypothetical protein